jgi:hypothetical protein
MNKLIAGGVCSYTNDPALAPESCQAPSNPKMAAAGKKRKLTRATPKAWLNV